MRPALDDHAHGRVRARRAARLRGDRDARPVPVALPRVVVYSAAGCGLCDRAVEIVRDVCGDGFELVAIDGVRELEERFRELIPVVSIDGTVAFTYFVDPDGLRERLAAPG